MTLNRHAAVLSDESKNAFTYAIKVIIFLDEILKFWNAGPSLMSGLMCHGQAKIFVLCRKYLYFLATL